MFMSYFGYGSLVNPDTLPEGVSLRPARLHGWRRVWAVRGNAAGTPQHRRAVCSLGVRPQPGASILGVVAREAEAGRPGLYRREARYLPVSGIGRDLTHLDDGSAGDPDAFLFRSRPEHDGFGDETCPVLQSYLDCVLAGFHAHWGEEGIVHFIETTDGWHVPVLNDRANPLYPRAKLIDDRLRRLFDAHLARTGLMHLQAH
ncbi:gamma-glutamylcyclotransferase [Microvirga tunisiensis]|uniref:Gamma-glutamylcyclotransferase n=2 Tax=Pannonibacter tanglangensis TaxID=2750084 RepID=A0A7X5F2K9_9HYPH|nr:MULTISPECIES: gamma-glutamylcyclotransferase family protein [unclassified Pannonibacter]NBN62664.1 gamma-glutamylcyclotransferase [Pannonibacter sp. XCT-34]NBN78319.1 gamma-glutamylcyclotransferase [Pannonibacter sp. XCT-53]